MTEPTAGPNLTLVSENPASAAFDALLDVSMPVTVEIGRTHLTLQELLGVAAGTVVPLERAVGEPVDVYVSDRRVAQGEVVVVGDRLGVRITRLVNSPSRTDAA